MKLKSHRFLMFLVAAAILVQRSASAQACPNNVSFGTFLVNGFACTIGNLSFSSFTYSSSAQGATAVMAADIMVEALGPTGSGASALNPGIGLQFAGNWSAAANSSSSSIVSFTVSVLNGGGPIADAGLVQTSAISGSGTASVMELGCSGGGTCSQQWDVSTFDGSSQLNLANTTFLTPASSVQVS